jgi:hypothetical protein
MSCTTSLDGRSKAIGMARFRTRLRALVIKVGAIDRKLYETGTQAESQHSADDGIAFGSNSLDRCHGRTSQNCLADDALQIPRPVARVIGSTSGAPRLLGRSAMSDVGYDHDQGRAIRTVIPSEI